MTLRPQPGPQWKAASSSADIVIYGGEAGGGKTFWLLLEPTRYITDPKFGAVLFRRTNPMIRAEGGMWDESADLYPRLGGHASEGTMIHRFPSGASISFKGLQHEKDVEGLKGAQIPFIGIDQLEEWSEWMFFYVLSRNRSMCEAPSLIRATCNPDADSFLASFLAWWIDQESGYPIPERDGIIRLMYRFEDTLYWGTTEEELRRSIPATLTDKEFQPKSVTFIASSVYDNVEMLRRNPKYIANLMALPYVERERLLGRRDVRGGNWKIRPSAGLVFNATWFNLLPIWPNDIVSFVRYWDKAGTSARELEAVHAKKEKHARTAGVLMGKRRTGRVIVLDVTKGHWGAKEREKVIKDTAMLDRATIHRYRAGAEYKVWIEQEPGSGGKESAENTILNLSGFTIHKERVTGDKYTRAMPLSAQAEAGNVDVLVASWTQQYLAAMHAFAPDSNSLKDEVDASSGAFNKIHLTRALDFPGTYVQQTL